MKHTIPLPDLLPPRTVEEIIGQPHLTAPGTPFRTLIESDKMMSFLLYGPPGTGKTTIAEVIAGKYKADFVRLNATSATVKQIREQGDRAIEFDRSTILFVDEIHRFSKSQQD